MIYFRLYGLAMLLALVLTPGTDMAKSPGNTRVTVRIEPVFNGQPLRLANQYYVDEHKDTIYIDEFKFYISDLKLSAHGGGISYPDAHLIDAEQDGTLSFHIDNMPYGTFTDMQFVVGVDSLANVSGANAGDLDPVKGMYWTWNSGYIMAKMTGHSKKCKTLHHEFDFHIGGYISPFNAARTVKIKLPYALDVKEGKNTVVTLYADAAAWFANKLDVSKVNNVVIPGKEAAAMADNYAKMFSVKNIKSE